MRRRISKTRAATKVVKNGLQLRAARDDHAGIDGTQFEQQAEVVQVAIIERILIIPFNFERNTIFVAVDLMCRRFKFCLVNDDFGLETFLNLTQPGEVAIETVRDRALATARFENVASQQAKAIQHGNDILPFLRVRG